MGVHFELGGATGYRLELSSAQGGLAQEPLVQGGDHEQRPGGAIKAVSLQRTP